jgi:predicted DNA-binding ribbon-helix-helix protein
MERQTTIGKLLAEIDRTGRLLPHQGPGRHRVRTLSAAVRIFEFQALMAKLADAEARANRRRPAARSYPTAHRPA